MKVYFIVYSLCMSKLQWIRQPSRKGMPVYNFERYGSIFSNYFERFDNQIYNFYKITADTDYRYQKKF